MREAYLQLGINYARLSAVVASGSSLGTNLIVVWNDLVSSLNMLHMYKY